MHVVLGKEGAHFSVDGGELCVECPISKNLFCMHEQGSTGSYCLELGIFTSTS